ncbi:hypothetical protein FKM82_019343 [Ascaphus truei]
MLCSDYLPDLLKQLSSSVHSSEPTCNPVSWDELRSMDLPSFEPAFLVLCRVLLNVIHECLKLRLEQRPAGEPSLLSIKQLVRECKEVLKGGLLMKQYYQFMLREVLDDLQKLHCNIDAFEEDLHKMLMVLIHSLEHLHVFVPDNLSRGKTVILQLLNAAAGIDCSKDCEEVAYEAFLLMTKHTERDNELEDSWSCWEGQTIKIVPPVETADTLRSVQVDNLLLVVMQSAHLMSHRKVFQHSIEGLLSLRLEQTSSHPVIAGALHQLKSEALQLCNKISSAIDRVEQMFTSEFEAEVEESESATLQQYYREAMIQGYNFGFEYHKEVVRLMSGEFRQKIGDKYISFARKWMNYVLTKCESGRGTRPRWATQGFDYLQAIEPAFISALPEDDFLSLQALMNECISHVIGKPHSPVTAIHRNSPRPVKVPRCHSDPPNPHFITPTPEGFSNRIVSCDARNLSNAAAGRPTPIGSESAQQKPGSNSNDTRGSSVPENDRLASIAAELQFRSLSRHSSPTDDREEPSYPKGDSGGSARRSWELQTLISQTRDTAARHRPMDAVQKSVQLFEEERYRQMWMKNIVGQVCDTPKSYDNVMHVGLRKVTFKWQRGNKIGEGQYGKVYTCISVDTGELMAMKEIRFQPNDHKTIKETADELKIFEGIKHPNLVRYFGVELHREEMYIFMEYCDEGTLEEVSRLGLQEHVIRLYTKQITIAINVLHEHGIVHRDIKGANIFLTSSGLIKLGDFGCSVKLKNNAQTMPGEVNSTMGTAAYMAPEVITRAKGEGHGRAADIWSLGCVVIEMVTGKRPWHEYEHNFQIMYKVGMGHKPPIPDRISPEGKDFLSHCLESEPKKRWTASQLLDHPFVKVCTDEE